VRGIRKKRGIENLYKGLESPDNIVEVQIAVKHIIFLATL
jgi:hypothetical protein